MVERGFPLCRRQPTGEQDSGSSAHSGRAGSSPASRTKKKTATERLRFFFLVCGGFDLNPIKKGPQTVYTDCLGKRQKLRDRDCGQAPPAHRLSSRSFCRCPASRIPFKYNMVTKLLAAKPNEVGLQPICIPPSRLRRATSH